MHYFRDSEIASDIEPAKPQVKQHLEDQIVSEGNKVRMDCIIVGQPEPEASNFFNITFIVRCNLNVF